MEWYTSCTSHSSFDNDVISIQVQVQKDVCQYNPVPYEDHYVVREVTHQFVYRITRKLMYIVYFEGFLRHQVVPTYECRLVSGGPVEP